MEYVNNRKSKRIRQIKTDPLVIPIHGLEPWMRLPDPAWHYGIKQSK